jgi:heme-degrading monooxygenase HmoA
LSRVSSSPTIAIKDEAMTSQFHLAQINIAKALAPLDSPIMQGFADQLEHINQLAERSPGFVWRLQTDADDATALNPYEDELIIVNLSVWESLAALKAYVYGGDHLSVLRNKKQWFEKPSAPTLALWWVPAGHTPSIAQGQQALETLRQRGPSAEVFSFASPFPAPGHCTRTQHSPA